MYIYFALYVAFFIVSKFTCTPFFMLKNDIVEANMFDFELDMSGDMDLGSYYADFAEGMLLEPPPPEFTEVCWDGGADHTVLWWHY
jgi:hypothetical protein